MAFSDSCCVGFDAVDQSLSMTLGRFLLFFVVGLVLAIAFPPAQLADMASCGFGRCCGGAFDSWLIDFNGDLSGHLCSFWVSCWVS